MYMSTATIIIERRRVKDFDEYDAIWADSIYIPIGQTAGGETCAKKSGQIQPHLA